MAELIDDLLRLARVTKTEFVRRPVNLSRLARVVSLELGAMDPSRRVAFEIQDDIAVEGDTRLLRIVLEHLLGNAWKFTARQESPRIEFGRIDGEGTSTCFVRDNGVGFDMRYINRLFRPFERLHSSSEFEGSGIGLAIVQRIIHRHNGRIWAESESGRDTTFYFVL